MDDGGVIAFHGCFSHGPRFGILLEYAPLGNLEEFFQEYEPPSGMEDILDLWISYFRLLSTLNCLRRMEYVDRESLQM